MNKISRLHIASGALALVMAGSAAAATTSSSLQLNSFSQGAEGIFVSFKTTPPGCSSSYKGYHALVPNSSTAIASILAVLTQRRITGAAMTVTYDTLGICDKPETLLLVREVK